ncbi:plasmid pRiA4b ORF-3 family protein [Microvirga calopogonii]|uniref:plasmid pRiA4b ORF-3 family protein n=1 Tax=Microvirga calopogonii TaxID=2078013 RepID=UPI001FE15A93|nr:plasmid pRiA4b ORF-3 family protein [Microvirga calopogonii]
MLEAVGRCPPKDVGGAPGYAEYLDAISDPAHPEHEQMRLWGPERFDPNVVDRKALEAAVNALSAGLIFAYCRLAGRSQDGD